MTMMLDENITSDEEISFSKKKFSTNTVLYSDDSSEGNTPVDNSFKRSVLEADSDVTQTVKNVNPKRLILKNKSLLDDSESDEENSNVINCSSDILKKDSFEFPDIHTEDFLASQEKQVLKKFDSDIYDAEGSSNEKSKENTLPADHPPDTSQTHFQRETSKQKKKSRKSRDQTEGKHDIEEIHSEAQRLVRESRVSLPYHRPKQRTLADFLTRRKCSPSVPLRNAKQMFNTVWKHLEEREKTTETFYKSESSEESDSGEKNEHKYSDENSIKHSQNNSVETSVEENKLDMENNDESNKIGVTLLQDDSKTSGSKPGDDIILGNEKMLEVEETAKKEDGGEVEETAKKEDGGEVFREEGEEIQDDKVDCLEGKDELGKADNENSEQEVNLSASHHDNAEFPEHNLLQSPVNPTNVSVEKTCPLEERQDKFCRGNLELSTSEVQMCFTPRLSADHGDVVDLDIPPPKTLIERFIKHVKLKPKVPISSSVSLKIVSSEKDNEGNVTKMEEEEVIVKKKENKSVCGITALKETLRQSIQISRNQQLTRRIQNYQLYEQETLGDRDKIISDEENLFGDEERDFLDNEGKTKSKVEYISKEYEEEDEESEEEDENSYWEPKKSKVRMLFADEEAEVSDDDGPASSDEESDSGSEEDSKQLDSNSKTVEEADPKEKLRALLCDTEKGSNDDLLAICSGQFQTQPIRLTQLEQHTQNCDTSVCSDQEDAREEAYSDGREGNDTESDEDEPEVPKQENHRLQDSDFSDAKKGNVIESDEDELDVPRKKTHKLQFSDDEDSEQEVEQEVEQKSEQEVEQESEEEVEQDTEQAQDNIHHSKENFLEYNSEEELVEGARFLDAEAELSGSDWESEDEDERGLSDFEADEADLEKINQSKLRSQLGKIHLKEMMAEDKREVRLLQEMLLEDGELHSDGPKRKRLFRWSNQGGELEGKLLGWLEQEGLHEDEEDVEELQWRQARIEREQFLNQSEVQEEVEPVHTDLPIVGSDKRKVPPAVRQNPPNHQLSPDPKQPFKLLSRRGSFLGRSQKLLSRLAGLVPAQTETANSRVKRNMVFTAVSPSKPEPSEQEPYQVEKRRATEDIPKVSKKLKLSSKNITIRKSSFFEKLKQFD